MRVTITYKDGSQFEVIENVFQTKYLHDLQRGTTGFAPAFGFTTMEDRTLRIRWLDTIEGVVISES